MTPDAIDTERRPVSVSMAKLAGLVNGSDGVDELSQVVESYAHWLREREQEEVETDLLPTARRHLDACAVALKRMRSGLSLLRSDSTSREAFRLANLAMLIQQQRSTLQPRETTLDRKAQTYQFSSDYVELDIARLAGAPNRWRAFQAGFVLMCLESASQPDTVDRDLVELIWFPTGGGKTEAYLLLAAFIMFYMRLRGEDHSAVDVLMRYTLRLLTTQQFQRASALLLAMEFLRVRDGRLGQTEFGIGIWVGGGSTPNTRREAATALMQLRNGSSERNPFVLLRCPWCQAGIGPIEARGNQRDTPGYDRVGDSVRLSCPDPRCSFHELLPVYVVDEDIYDARPAFLLGTVDKFAGLARRPEARALFGLGLDGARAYRPPSLIIQDELHLISGPLGTIVGLYEGLIEELCTDRRGATPIRPKIITSTATIRRYSEQIRALYGRTRAALFPPPALSASDSFFSRFAEDEDGTRAPGRCYVGVFAPGLGSQQTAEVRTVAALLEAPMLLPEGERDPWWTQLVFFNSLRELGAGLSLCQSDIPDYVNVVRERHGWASNTVRRLRRPVELTGRLSDSEIPERLDELGVAVGDTRRGGPLDVCLASNILEVGIDVQRLGMMIVVGQPKTTSQYIQVTGRVGRRGPECPGLVVTVYSAAKPRDRSHYEKFRSYHERLYAQVEPTSVTPFSAPALERALHAVLIGWVRQFGPVGINPYPIPRDLVAAAIEFLRERLRVVTDGDPSALTTFDQIAARRERQWGAWTPDVWEQGLFRNDGARGLMRSPGDYIPSDIRDLTWATPTSMRNVDAECQTEITTRYAAAGGD